MPSASRTSREATKTPATTRIAARAPPALKSRMRTNGVVHAPLRPQGLADLADRAARAQRLAHRRQEVRLSSRRCAHVVERTRGRLGIALGAHLRRPLELPALGGGIDA